MPIAPTLRQLDDQAFWDHTFSIALTRLLRSKFYRGEAGGGRFPEDLVEDAAVVASVALTIRTRDRQQRDADAAPPPPVTHVEGTDSRANRGGGRVTVKLSVGIGAWSFYVETALAAVPRVGDCVAASGDGRVYEVHDVTITPATIYVRCKYPFISEEAALEAEKEWTGRV